MKGILKDKIINKNAKDEEVKKEDTNNFQHVILRNSRK